jgi:hypothetical protein
MREFETLENRFVISITPMGLVLGKIAEGAMINPRVIETGESKEPGKMAIKFKQLFGNPNEYFYSYGQYYISENSELNELYETSIEPKRIIIPSKELS